MDFICGFLVEAEIWVALVYNSLYWYCYVAIIARYVDFWIYIAFMVWLVFLLLLSLVLVHNRFVLYSDLFFVFVLIAWFLCFICSFFFLKLFCRVCCECCFNFCSDELVWRRFETEMSLKNVVSSSKISVQFDSMFVEKKSNRWICVIDHALWFCVCFG